MSEIAERFEHIAAMHPDLVAVKSGDRSLSYRELNTLANALARSISAQCPNEGGTVALLLEHGVDLALGALACLKAGKIYVPLDLNNPADRQRRILEHAQSRLLLTDGTCSMPLPDGMRVHDINAMSFAGSVENPEYGSRSDDLAFLLYTSGSTGMPKGVMYQNRAVISRVAEHNRFHVGPGDRLTALGPGGMNLFRALLTGATLVSLNLRKVEIDSLAHWLMQEEVTIYHSVPTVFRRLVASLSGRLELPNLRLVNLTGETLLSQDVEAFRSHFPKTCVLVNGLGTTEAGTFREYRIDNLTVVAGGVVPVGVAVEDTEVRLLNPDGSDVNPGEIGEIAVRGEYLSPGYWRQPELTEARFLPARNQQDNRRTYLTGDLGQFLPDGSLMHLGREDYQVKIRGHRVEVGEVESAYLDHPGISEVAVVGEPQNDGVIALVAYAVARGPVRHSDELLSFVRQRLPEYMVPRATIYLERLPVTPNGKVDRNVLSSQVPSTAVSVTRESPRNETEKRLSDMWCDILQVQDLSIHDDFFALGGDSLTATRLMARIFAAFAVELPTSTVFREPTVAQLAVGLLLPEQIKPSA